MTKLLQPLSIPTPVELAVRLRDKLKTRCSDAAMFLQQLHYWLTKQQGKIIDGVRWIHNTYTQWLGQFPWWKEWDFRVITKVLREEGLIEFKQLNDHGRDRTGYYTLNYEHEWLKDRTRAVAFRDLSPNSSDAEATTTPIHPSTALESDRTEITSETTTEIQPEWKKPKKKITSSKPINPPTMQQMAELEQAKASRLIKEIIVQPWEDGEAVVVDTWRRCVPWWEYLTQAGFA